MAALDGYFKTQATQDAQRRTRACWVAVQDGTQTVAGYYTLAASSVAVIDLSESLAKRLPRYPSVPVARVGRLAIEPSFQGQKLGAALLADAALRALRFEVAVFARAVDAKDAAAVVFCWHHGFEVDGRKPKPLVASLASFLGRA